ADTVQGVLQGGTHGGVEFGQGPVEGVLGDTDVGELDPVEAFGEFDQRLDTTMLYVLAQGTYVFDGGVHVDCGSWESLAGIAVGSPEVDSTEHEEQSSGRVPFLGIGCPDDGHHTCASGTGGARSAPERPGRGPRKPLLISIT